MTALVSLIACVIVAVFFVFVFKIRRFVGDLIGALQSKRHLLPNELSKFDRWLGFEALLLGLNELIDRNNNYSNTHLERLNQLKVTLGSIQENVIIYDDVYVIEYANEAARQLFRRGEKLEGLRLESVLRAPSLIEYLNNYAEDRSQGLQQVSLVQEEVTLWFEVSIARVHEPSERAGSSTLLVLHDITQLKRLEEIRRDFIANASHELRTPLTILKGYVEALVEENETLPMEMRARFLKKIKKNTERLHLLVEDLMVLSRLESKPNQIQLTVGSLRQLIEEIIENYRFRLDANKQEIVLTFDEYIQEFAFDHFRIHQVFDNLIENVFKYAPDFTKMHIKVSYDKTANSVKCMVGDDGPGIPERDLPHIFERFYRVDKGRLYEHGGTGLGLCIMKHIVQQHGGAVFAESEFGKGTKIYFSLPFSMDGSDSMLEE